MKSLISVFSLDSQPHLYLRHSVDEWPCHGCILSCLWSRKNINWTISSVNHSHIWLEHNNILYSFSAMDSVTSIPQGYLKALSLCNNNTITIPHEASLRVSSSDQTLSVSLYFTFQGPFVFGDFNFFLISLAIFKIKLSTVLHRMIRCL